MIYLLTIIVIFYLIYIYDISGGKKNRILFYNLLLLWLIFISGFQYCVGADTPRYMSMYDEFKLNNFNWKYVFTYNLRMQPGWNLLMYFCHIISDDYLAFKIIQAAVLNITILYFFKKNCKNIFTCALLYCIYLYLDYNFNMMRQSFSLAIFLLSYDFFLKKKWIRYYLCALLSISFHIGGLLLLILPLFTLIKINSRSLILIGAVLLLGFTALTRISVNTLVGNLLRFAPNEVNELGTIYLESEKLGQSTNNFFSYCKILIKSLLFFYILYYNYKYKLISDGANYSSYLMYMLLFIITGFMPIFFRFNCYFEVIMICFASNFIIDFPLRYIKNIKRLTAIIILVIFIYFVSPIKGYFAFDDFVGAKRWVQYYPYYTVFNKTVDRTRASIWGYYK